MKIKPHHRKKLIAYLKKFYEYYPSEKYTIFHFVRYFKKRLRLNKDAWMGVSGETGVGKSYFVLMTQILFGRPFSLIDNVSYIPKGDEIIEKFKKLKFQTFLVDEAAREMRSVNWHSKSQQAVNTAAMTERYKNNWVFLNMPNFNEFTKSMRRTNIIFRAIIPYRTLTYARVFIQRKSRNWRDDDPWADKWANDRYQQVQKRYKEITNDNINDIERNAVNYVMDFIVPNLSLILPDVTEEYERLKMESRLDSDMIVSETEKRNIWKEKYEKFMIYATKFINDNLIMSSKFSNGMKKDKVCKELGISASTFNKFLKKPKGEDSKKLFHKKLMENIN